MELQAIDKLRAAAQSYNAPKRKKTKLLLYVSCIEAYLTRMQKDEDAIANVVSEIQEMLKE